MKWVCCCEKFTTVLSTFCTLTTVIILSKLKYIGSLQALGIVLKCVGQKQWFVVCKKYARAHKPF